MKRLLLALCVLFALVGPARARGEPADPVPVNVNTATEADLIRLPFIGPAKAAAILARRQKVGSFKRLEDMLHVRGIGKKTLARLRPYITVELPKPPDRAPDAQ
ncbi:MAG TPA: helix-hairpin-helix domain-containing protein [Haliangiales bacterium]|nr:helix-hairpin-helix domain-containing protein [Haliangiales bacterium]